MGKFEIGNKEGKKFGHGAGDQDPTKGGRKPKIYKIIKELGYGQEDIKAVFGELAFYTEEDLAALIGDKDAPIITKITAKALKNAYATGNYSQAKDILEQVVGKAKEVKQLTATVDHTYSDLTEEELNEKIKNAEQRG